VPASAVKGVAAVNVLTLTRAIIHFSETARILIVGVVGGVDHFIGPILAAPPINFLATYLQALGEWSRVLFTAAVMVVMRSYPE
jgi:ABC-type branched-subunit amino acid transport system permease subunit